MPPAERDERALAATLLAQLLGHQGSLATLLAGTEVSAKVREYCYGVMRWYFQLDALLNLMLDKPLRRKDLDIKALLLLGLYQSLHMRTPSHALVQETVAASDKIKKPWARGLINGVLRRFLREQDALCAQLTTQQTRAFPDWLHKRIDEAWPDNSDDIFRALNSRPPMTLRVNRQNTSREEYLDLLAEQEIVATAGELSESAVYLDTARTVEQLPGFDTGRCSVQDEAAQCAAALLDPAAGETILDACAAPGGKTTHLLELEAQIKVLAIDNHATRIQRVKENLQRLRQTANVLLADANKLDDWWDGDFFDRILLDAPCSATGVIRRNPDIKYLRQETDVAELQRTQGALLRTLWQTLRPGGAMLYVTCSILPEENEQIVDSFLAETADATHDLLPEWLGVERGWGRQLLPGRHDGFYYARLGKSPAAGS